jgi:hypothetical protein
VGACCDMLMLSCIQAPRGYAVRISVAWWLILHNFLSIGNIEGSVEGFVA